MRTNWSKTSNLLMDGVLVISLLLLSSLTASLWAQTETPAQTPALERPAGAPQGPPPGLGRVQPNYPVPYKGTSIEETTKVLNRILMYLDGVTPARVENRQTREEITDFAHPNRDAVFARGAFLLISYEWGVTYSGMLAAAEATGDSRFSDYTGQRLEFLARMAPYFRAQMPPASEQPSEPRPGQRPDQRLEPRRFSPMRSVLDPRSLDDSGSMCAAMIKANRAGVAPDVRPLIDNYMKYISSGQFRLEDGTLARNRPMPNTLWLDDLYMSVPALAQMGKLTGDRRYYDDAVKQILQFADRMFVKEKGLYMHGWVAGMNVHPAFHWARANGWAIMAKTELLEVLPEDHPGRAAVLDLLRAHIRGLATCQSGSGLWHQLLDRNDSYLETSASAMFVYCIARAINRGWIDPLAHGPMAQLGWDAVATKVNAEGQVEDTCVGTGMGFDPMFYYYRPVSVFAAHGYGPVLLAGAELIQLAKGGATITSEGALQYRPAASR
jgi:unsaturated rhamnogalacturonyl hydrolase